MISGPLLYKADTGRQMYCAPSIWAGNWSVNEYDEADEKIERHFKAVVDDFGDLRELADEWGPWLHSHGGVGAQSDEEDAAWQRHLYVPPATRGPAPVSAAVEPNEDGFCGRPVTNITISDDERWSTSQLYRIDVARSGEGPLYVSHAQLAALLVAAESLCKPARRKRVRA